MYGVALTAEFLASCTAPWLTVRIVGLLDTPCRVQRQFNPHAFPAATCALLMAEEG